MNDQPMNGLPAEQLLKKPGPHDYLRAQALYNVEALLNSAISHHAAAAEMERKVNRHLWMLTVMLLLNLAVFTAIWSLLE